MDGYPRSSGLRAIIESTARPDQTDSIQLQSALHEIECHRDAIRRSYIRVMLGKMRTGLEDDAQLPADVRATIALVDYLESRMRSAKSFILNRLPAFASAPRTPEETALPSFEAGGVKYLFSRERAEHSCFLIALPLEEYLAFEVDDSGRINDADRVRLHAKPCIYLPQQRVREMRRRNGILFDDRAGFGDFLPSFLALYTEFVAFAVEDQPAVLGAHLLSKRFPGPARDLLDDHSAKTMGITRRLLEDLGYRDLVAEATGAEASFAVTGMTLFNVLKRWENHCCKSLFLNDFAEHFCRTQVDKVSDLEHLVAAPSEIPAPM